MRDRKTIEKDAEEKKPTVDRAAILWHEPILGLVLEVLLDIRDLLKERKL
jgi:hypothetical protein